MLSGFEYHEQFRMLRLGSRVLVQEKIHIHFSRVINRVTESPVDPFPYVLPVRIVQLTKRLGWYCSMLCNSCFSNFLKEPIATAEYKFPLPV